MTNKELLYIEDAISHESFLAKSASNASKQLLDVPFANYMKELKILTINYLQTFLIYYKGE